MQRPVLYIHYTLRTESIEHALPARWLEGLTLREKGYASQYSVLRKVFLLLSVLHQKITNNPAEPSSLLGQDKERERETSSPEPRCRKALPGRARRKSASAVLFIIVAIVNYGGRRVSRRANRQPLASLPNLPQPSIQAFASLPASPLLLPPPLLPLLAAHHLDGPKVRRYAPAAQSPSR